MENACIKNVLMFLGENLRFGIQLGLMNNLGSWAMWGERLKAKFLIFSPNPKATER